MDCQSLKPDTGQCDHHSIIGLYRNSSKYLKYDQSKVDF